MSDTIQTLKQNIRKICSEYLQGPWKNATEEDLKLSEVKGGLSSGLGLYLCTLSNSLPNPSTGRERNLPKEILIRFHNRNLHSDEEIIHETVIFTFLSEKKLGPHLYGIFPGGRLEQYLPSRSTDWDDFPDLYLLVAKEMARIHSLDVPIRKVSVFEERTYEWLEEFERVSKIKPIAIPDYVASGELRKEIVWLTKEIQKLNPKVTFCHNDLQGGNVLLLNRPPQSLENKIMFIDYEFAGYNYRTFDMANYFLVKCLYFKPAVVPFTFKCDLDKYPTKTQQEEFVNAYVNQLFEENVEIRNTSDKKSEINEILKEIEIFKYAPFLYWLAFGARESLNPRVPVPFDETSKSIWNMYKELKERSIKGKC